MKLKFFILQILLATCSLFSLQGFSQNVEPTSEFLLQLATNELPKHLDIIRSDNITFYGFRSEDDVTNIKLGEPMQTCYLSSDFYTDSILKDKDYMVYANEYRIPMFVKDTIRSFMMIAMMDKKWKVVGTGGNKLAERMDKCMKKYNLNKDGKLIILRDCRSNTDFLSPEKQDKNLQEYCPMNDDFTNNAADKKFQSQELLQILYNKHKNK